MYAARTLPALEDVGDLAVKVLSVCGEMALGEARKEIELLSVCRHDHMLTLVGYCLDLGALALVFPLMQGGNVEDRLICSVAGANRLRLLGWAAHPPPLEWEDRLRIICETTQALIYLHTPIAGSKGRVLHRDVKPSNILLDASRRAYLADTGLAKSTHAQPLSDHFDPLNSECEPEPVCRLSSLSLSAQP